MAQNIVNKKLQLKLFMNQAQIEKKQSPSRSFPKVFPTLLQYNRLCSSTRVLKAARQIFLAIAYCYRFCA